MHLKKISWKLLLQLFLINFFFKDFVVTDIFHQNRFGYFDLEQAWWYFELFQALQYPMHNIRLNELYAGHIDGNFTVVNSLIHPAAQLTAGFADNPIANLYYQAALFRELDEFQR